MEILQEIEGIYFWNFWSVYSISTFQVLCRFFLSLICKKIETERVRGFPNIHWTMCHEEALSVEHTPQSVSVSLKTVNPVWAKGKSQTHKEMKAEENGGRGKCFRATILVLRQWNCDWMTMKKRRKCKIFRAKQLQWMTFLYGKEILSPDSLSKFSE